MSSWSKNEKIKEEKTLKNEFIIEENRQQFSRIFTNKRCRKMKKKLKNKTKKKPCNTKKTKNLCFFGPNLINIRKRI